MVHGAPVVQTFDVSRDFPVGSETVHAVRDVSLTVNRGEFVALIGRSGSGKTTLLNIIAGLDKPTRGRVEIDGQDITSYSEKQLTALRRHQIGFIFQSFGLLPLLSAAENVEIALRIAGAGLRERRRRSAELMELVGLAGRASHRPYELSGGEQQRVAIARSLANNPAIILADEPTGELDSSTAVSIFQLLGRLVEDQGMTIITTTHDRTVMELVPRVEEMGDGRMLGLDESELLAYTTREERSKFAAVLPLDVQEEVSANTAQEPEVRHVVRHRELPSLDSPESADPDAWKAPAEERETPPPAATTVTAAPEGTADDSKVQARPEDETAPASDAAPETGPRPDFEPPLDIERPRWAPNKE